MDPTRRPPAPAGRSGLYAHPRRTPPPAQPGDGAATRRAGEPGTGYGASSSYPGPRQPLPGGRPFPGGRPTLPGGRPALPGGRPVLPGGREPLPGGRPLPGGASDRLAARGGFGLPNLRRNVCPHFYMTGARGAIPIQAPHLLKGLMRQDSNICRCQLRGGVHLEQGYVTDICLSSRFNQCVFYEDELSRD